MVWIYVLLSILKIYDLSGYFIDFPEVHLTYFGVFSLVFPYFLSALIIENLLILKEDAFPIVIKVAKISLYIIVINSILTIVSELYFPGITRNISARTNFPSWVTTHTFGAIYGLPFILSAILANYRGKKKFFYVAFFIILGSLLVAGFTTALLFSALFFITALLIRYRVKNIIYFVSFFTILLIVVFNNIAYVIKILPKLPNPVYSQKITDFTMILEGDGNYTDIRAGVYQVSLESFRENLLFGSGTWKSVGEHSYFLDRLGLLGFFGTIFFIVVLFNLFNRAILIIPKEGIITYKYWFFILMVLLIFNPFYNFDFWLIMFVYLPFFICYLIIDSKKPSKNYLTI